MLRLRRVWFTAGVLLGASAIASQSYAQSYNMLSPAGAYLTVKR